MGEVKKTNGNGKFAETISTLYNGMDSFLTTKTVVGDPIQVGDTTLIPLVDVNFAVGAGAMSNGKGGNNAGGAIGGKMCPTAVMVIKNDFVQVLPVHDDSSLSAVLNKIPGLIDKVADVIQSSQNPNAAAQKKAVDDAIDDLEDIDI